MSLHPEAHRPESRQPPGAAPERYALVVVLEAESPDAAWQALRATAGKLEGEPDCIHIGAPWQGVPAEAEDLATDHLELRVSVPNGGGRHVAITAVLEPCE